MSTQDNKPNETVRQTNELLVELDPTTKPKHACLQLLSGLEMGRIFPLPTEASMVVLGRAEDTDICLPYPEIAPHHARLIQQEAHVFLEDLESLSGTFVQGHPLQKRQHLQDGMRFQLGPHLIFKLLWLAQDELACQEQLYISSSHDALTELSSPRHFQALLTHEWSYAKRHQRLLSLVVCDIDHFQQLNKTYGYQDGDKLLCQVSERLRRTIRREDIAGRVGSDAFAVLLRETSISGALQQAERLRQRIATTPFALQQATPSLSVSMGAAALVPSMQHTPQDLFQAALQQLQEAQRLGGNRIYPPSIPPTPQKETKATPPD